MGTIAGKSSLVARRYAAALIDMARDGKALDAVEKDLADLQAMLDNSQDLQKLVANPLISGDKKKAAILALADKAKFDKLTTQFLGTLADNNRLTALRDVMNAFRAALAESRGEVSARVQTAFALSPAQTKELQEQLSKAMGSHVTLDVSVNKDLLGGMVVTVGSKQIDDSVKRKLELLKRAMNNNNDQKAAG